MGSLVQTKTITKLCNPILHLSDWKSMEAAIILGQVAEWIGRPLLDTLSSGFEPHSVYRSGFFSPKFKGSTELGAPLDL